MGKHLYADPMVCTGCRICQLVCSFDKTGTLNPDRARVRVERYDDGRDVVISCHNCDDAPCIEVCPTEAITRDDAIRINAEECIGCGVCVNAPLRSHLARPGARGGHRLQTSQPMRALLPA